MLYPLVFAGLVIAVILYAALIRRRADGRAMGLTLATQLTASNQTALERIADAARRRRESLENAPAVAAPAAALVERRSGIERRTDDRHRGRGRRQGGDRRVAG